MTIEYEDLDEATTEEEEESQDRGDNLEDEELEDQDESEDEAEETDDDESEEADEDEDEEEYEEEAPQKNTRVPKARLDEVIRQREEARERSEWLETQLEKLISSKVETPVAPKPAYDFEVAEEEYVALIIQGEVAKASKLRREIDAARKDEFQSLLDQVKDSAKQEAKSESSSAIEQERFETAVVNFENKYKFLNYELPEYNEEAVDTVNTLMSGYVSAGKSKAEALKLAVNKVAPLYSKVSPEKPTLGNKRKVEAGRKAVKAANSQPSKTKSVSTRQVDAETVDVKKMSEKDFSKLTAKEKSILRGDSF